MLNSGYIPEYIKQARLNMLSKTDTTQVTVGQIRPIVILSHTLKVIEKAVKNKVESLNSGLFKSGKYQVGFEKGHST